MEGDETQSRRRATMKDVARVAGVSLGTVSHVLNGTKKASAGATEAVNAAVIALDYRPNSLARSLIARRPGRPPQAMPGGPRLVTVGYLSIDYMVSVDRVPESGARMTSGGIEKMIGGPAANVAAFAAGVGPPLEVKVEIISHIGTDADSDWALEELALRGIDASGTMRQPGKRLSRCIVLVDAEGERTIVNEPLHVPVDLVTRHLEADAGETGAACVHFDGFHLATAEKVHRQLRQSGYRLSFHSVGLPAAEATVEGCRRLMRLFDMIVLDRATFAGIVADDPALRHRPERLFDLQPDPSCKAIVLTRGAEGAVLLRLGTEPLHQPAPPTRVTDATGAGDALTGVLLASWLSQGDLDLALAHAVRGASLSVTALGAQGRRVRAADIGADASVARLEV